jgi:hypothetical protein
VEIMPWNNRFYLAGVGVLCAFLVMSFSDAAERGGDAQGPQVATTRRVARATRMRTIRRGAHEYAESAPSADRPAQLLPPEPAGPSV